MSPTDTGTPTPDEPRGTPLPSHSAKVCGSASATPGSSPTRWASSAVGAVAEKRRFHGLGTAQDYPGGRLHPLGRCPPSTGPAGRTSGRAATGRRWISRRGRRCLRRRDARARRARRYTTWPAGDPVGLGPFLVVGAEAAGQSLGDEAGAQHVLHRLAEGRVGRHRQDVDQLGQPRPWGLVRHRVESRRQWESNRPISTQAGGRSHDQGAGAWPAREAEPGAAPSERDPQVRSGILRGKLDRRHTSWSATSMRTRPGSESSRSAARCWSPRPATAQRRSAPRRASRRPYNLCHEEARSPAPLPTSSTRIPSVTPASRQMRRQLNPAEMRAWSSRSMSCSAAVGRCLPTRRWFIDDLTEEEGAAFLSDLEA